MTTYFKNKFSLTFIINFAFLSFLIPNSVYSQLICNSEIKFDKLDKQHKQEKDHRHALTKKSIKLT